MERLAIKRRFSRNNCSAVDLISSSRITFRFEITIKDGAYYCNCAHILRISRYSGFLSVMLNNTGIFLRSLKLSGESRL